MFHQMWSDGPDILTLCSISSQNSLICMIEATLLEADETTVPKAHIDDWERPTSIFFGAWDRASPASEEPSASSVPRV